MRVGLVLGGDPPSSADLKLLDACDHIVACDAGAHALLQGQRPPELIVGDLDSLDPETFKWADALDVTIERHPERKDKTDGELALEAVFRFAPTAVLILGGHGGRSSMFLANLKLLRRCHDKGIEASMVGNGESIRLVSQGGELNLAGRTGATLNVLAIDGPTVVSLLGTEWEVEEAVLEPREARGVSNGIISDGARIRVHKGTALVIIERQDRG